MLLATFRVGSGLHLATVAVCLVLVGLFLVLARNASPERRRRLRAMIGWGCLLVWIMNTLYWAMPGRFSWATSLPIHVCNLANLIGAVAVLRHQRIFQGLLYFWAFSLCIWAFITPTVGLGPARPGFWVFWIYHLFIGLAVAQVLVVDRFRPSGRDLLNAILCTLFYVAVVATLDRVFGWNYGFLGASVPTVPTPVDLLGPYPLRLLWMCLIGAVAFVILWLPWRLAVSKG